MIVKMDDGDGGWVMVEARRISYFERKHALRRVMKGIDLFRVKEWKNEEPTFEKDCTPYNEMFYSGGTHEALSSGDMDYALASLVYAWHGTEPTTPKVYVVVGSVYIMNDQGKTIERL